MKKKREYLAANIRKGYTVKNAATMAKTLGAVQPFAIKITSMSHGRDVNGNGTAHYSCHIVATHKTDGRKIHFMRVVESGKRREQVGYSGKNEAALYALDKLGFKVDTSSKGSYDSHGEAYYPLLNFPPVELTQ